ncbi:MAG: hypothetical protein H7289_02980, partial [Mucilaginibacter sp.]|nr:hypothetical protein [Mucilaginibacter sp.]
TFGINTGTDNALLSDYQYTLGIINEGHNDAFVAKNYESAIAYNPYLFKVYPWLITYYNKSGQPDKAAALRASLKRLKIQPGPGIAIIN